MRKSARTGTSSGRRVGMIVVAAAAAVAGGMSAGSAYGQTAVSWVGATGDYQTGANWSSGVTPANANNEFLMINNGGTAQVSAGGEGAFLHLGISPGDAGSLEITGGTLSLGEMRVGGRETIPNPSDPLNPIPNGGGTGSVIQTGGTVNVNYSTGTEPPIQSLYVGDSGLASGNTANGSYTIKNNAVLLSGIANNDSIVVGTGVGAQGSFLQQDNSTVTSTGFVLVGRRGATGTYTLNGGTLTAQATGANGLWIGDGDTTGIASTRGVFTQTGGSVSVGGALEIGRRNGTGTYTLTGGSVSAGSLVVGSGGSGTNAALLNAVGSMTVNQDTGTSTVAVTGNGNIGFTTTTLATTGGLLTGTLNMSAGKMSFTGASAIVGVGNGPGASGAINLSGGTIEFTGTGTTAPVLDLGRNGGISSLVNVTGTGTLNAKEVLFASAHVNFAGYPAVSTRRLTVKDSGTFTADLVWFGNARTTVDTRELLIQGGTSTIGVLRTGNTGLTTISGGNVTIGSINTTPASGSIFNNGTVNISGGTVTVNGIWNLSIGSVTGAMADVNISGGNVTVDSLNTTGIGLLKLTGGSLAVNNFTLSSSSTLRTENNITFSPTSTVVGNATVDVVNGSLTLTSAYKPPAGGRTLTKAGAGTLNLNGSWVPDAVNPGTSNITTSVGTTNINFNVGPTVNINLASGTAVNLSTSQTANDVINSGGVLTLNSGGNKTLAVNSLTISGGTVDITNNALQVVSANTPATTVRAYLQAAYNNGAWNQPGLTSSTARDRADNATALGYMDNGTQVLVKYTWAGDLNLDGKLNGDDYTLIDRQVAKNGIGAGGFWVDGDVNYDGVVNAGDYLIVDAAYFYRNGTLAPGVLTTREAEFGAEYVSQLMAAVPEPTCLGGLMVAAAGLARPGRRRRSD